MCDINVVISFLMLASVMTKAMTEKKRFREPFCQVPEHIFDLFLFY